MPRKHTAIPADFDYGAVWFGMADRVPKLEDKFWVYACDKCLTLWPKTKDGKGYLKDCKMKCLPAKKIITRKPVSGKRFGEGIGDFIFDSNILTPEIEQKQIDRI